MKEDKNSHEKTTLRCPHCNQGVRTSATALGKKKPCPACKGEFAIIETADGGFSAVPLGRPSAVDTPPPMPIPLAPRPGQGTTFLCPHRDWCCTLPSEDWDPLPFIACYEANADVIARHPEIGTIKFISHVWYRGPEALREAVDSLVHSETEETKDRKCLRKEETTVASCPAIMIEYQGVPLGGSELLWFVAYAFSHRDDRGNPKLFLVVACCRPGGAHRLRKEVAAAMQAYSIDAGQIAAAGPHEKQTPEDVGADKQALLVGHFSGESQEEAGQVPAHIAMLGTSVSSQGGSCFYSDEHGYVFGVVNEGWERSSDEAARQADADLQLEHAELGVIRCMVGYWSQGLDGMMQNARDMLATAFSSFRETSSGERSIAGCLSPFLEGEGVVQGRPFRIVVHVLALGSQGFQFVWAGPPDAFDRLQEDVQSMVDSMHIDPPTPDSDGTPPAAATGGLGETFAGTKHQYQFTTLSPGWSRCAPSQEPDFEVDLQVEHPDVGVVRIVANECKQGFEEMFDGMEQAYRSDCTSFRLYEKGRRTVAGYQAGHIEFEGYDPALEATARIRAYVFVRDGVVFQIIGMSPPHRFHRMAEEVAAVANSFVFREIHMPDDLVELLRSVNHELDKAKAIPGLVMLGTIAVIFLVSWWAWGFCLGLIPTVVLVFIAFGVGGISMSYYAGRILDNGHRQRINEAAQRAAVSQNDLTAYIEHHFSDLKDAW